MIRADLHIHSIVSDGMAHPHDIVRYARRVGLNAISITDHNTFLGAVIASRSYVKDVTVIYGNEVRTEFGDILLLCEDYFEDVSTRFNELIDITRSYNCLLIPAHPLAILRRGMGYYVVKYYVNVWDGVEVFNGASDPLTNILTYRLFEGFPAAKIANSDAHILNAVGTTYTLIESKSNKVEDILEAIRKGMTIPVYNLNSLSLRLQILRITWSIKRFLKQFNFRG